MFSTTKILRKRRNDVSPQQLQDELSTLTFGGADSSTKLSNGFLPCDHESTINFLRPDTLNQVGFSTSLQHASGQRPNMVPSQDELMPPCSSFESMLKPLKRKARNEKTVRFLVKRRELKMKLTGHPFTTRTFEKNSNRQKAALNRKRDNTGKFLDGPHRDSTN